MGCIKKCFQISLLLSIIHDIFPADISFIGCKDKQGIDYLNVEKAIGTWYMYESTPRNPLEHVRCTTLEFNLPIKGMWPAVRYEIDRDLFGKENQNKYSYNLTMKGAGRGSTPDFFDYVFLDIDYDKYAIMYICQNYQIAKRDATTILTRERFPSSDIVLKTHNVVWAHDLSMDNVEKVNQTNCPSKWNAEEKGISGLMNLFNLQKN